MSINRSRESVRARWARRFANLAIPVAILTALFHRTGLVETPSALASYVVAIVLGLAALGLGIGAVVAAFAGGRRGTGDALYAIAVGLAVLAPIGFAGYRLVDRPMINDVTTIPEAAPEFRAVRADRPDGANSIRYDPSQAEIQRAAYPAIRPLRANFVSEDVFFVAADLAADRRWLILDQTPPTADFAGRIEAVATTLFFGFRDDVIILVTTEPEGARVDMRSASRYGRHDLGANADRIDAFLRDLKTQLEVVSRTPAEPPPAEE